MNQTLKGILIGLVMLYIVSPFDAMPGPMDDLLVTLLGYVGTRMITGKKKETASV
jgi:hypothetical protein